MASISTSKTTGKRRILFVGPDGERKQIRLGKVSKRDAEAIKIRIETLLNSRMKACPIDRDTAGWVGNLEGAFRVKLERAGLVESVEQTRIPKLGAWLERYIQGRPDVKKSTATVYGHTQRNLVEYFGADRTLDKITLGDVDSFRVHLSTKEKLADNTVRRRMGIAKQFFRAAIRRKLISENPFEGQSTVVRRNAERFVFITRQQAEKVLDACPDIEWRLIFALARFGGLRVPSEVLSLRWGDVDFGNMRFTVHSSKTEHLGKGTRPVPIFPELYSLLLDAFDNAEPGAEYVISQYDPNTENLRTQFKKIIKRAGLTPWPKLFQNLRSTRETELAETYPVQVVCEWIGNTPKVAANHYLQVTEEHYRKATQKAAQNPAQQSAESVRMGSQCGKDQIHESEFGGVMRDNADSCKSFNCKGMGRTGLEPVTSPV